MTKVFEIRVTDTEDQNDVATYEYLTKENDRTAEELIDLVGQSINYQSELEFEAHGRFITIAACSDDEGYLYDVYESRDAYERGDESLDGGQCTWTINEALTMAIEAAKVDETLNNLTK